MGIFSRKKRPEAMDLPPPPSPEELEEGIEEPSEVAMTKLEVTRPVKKYDIPPPPDDFLAKMHEKPVFRGDVPPIRGAPKQKPFVKLPPMPEMTEEEFMPEAEPMPGLPPEMEDIRKEAIGGVKRNIEPIFVEVGDYQAIIDRSKAIRSTLKEAEDAVIRMGNIKSEEERIISEWKKQLEDVEKKITYVDEAVFGGE